MKASLIENEVQKKMKLENDPACGITTGGKENCEWDCLPDDYAYIYWRFPTCLTDCFPEGHCASKVLEDFKNAEGICGGSSFVPPQFNVTLGSGIPVTTKVKCEYTTYTTPNGNQMSVTTKGIFSEDTLQSLLQDEACMYDVYRKSPAAWSIIAIVVQTSSNPQVTYNWLYFSLRIIRGLSEKDIMSQLDQILNIESLKLQSSASLRLLPGVR